MLYIPTFSEHLLTNDMNKQVVKLSCYVNILYDELLVRVMLGEVVQKSVLADKYWRISHACLHMYT